MKAFSRHLAWLAQLLQRSLAELPPPAAPVPAVRPFSVVLATLDGDSEGEVGKRLAAALDGRKGLLVRPVAAVAADSARAARLLAEEDADLLIWGAVHPKGVTLTLGVPHADAQGAFPVRLDLPPAVEGPVADMLHGAALAALEPRTEPQRRFLHDLLPPAMANCEAVAKKMPTGLNIRQQVGLVTAYGHLAAAMAAVEPAGDWLGKAEGAFAAALKRLPPKDRTPVDEAALLRHLAGVLTAKAERAGTEAAWEAAIAAARAALAALPRVGFPLEWAAEHNRLGVALYRFDLRTGRTELLKEAIGSFQTALQVFTRAEHPRRWAEVANNLAQALQVYGDAIKSVEVLGKAVDACRAVLDIRKREADPLGWAATMNTLGTALFLRDKHADESGHLEEAAETLRAAAEAYRALGLAKLAGLAEKNRGHVERLLKERAERRPRFDWAEE